MFGFGGEYPPVPLAFFSVALVVAMQTPAYFLIGAGYMLPGVAANEVFSVFLVPFLLSLFLKFDMAKVFPLKAPGRRVLILAFLFILGADVLIDYLTSLSEWFFPLPVEYKSMLESLMSAECPGEFALKLFVLCVIPGICEEVYFRGFFQTAISVRLGNFIAVAAASFMFALLHGNPWYFHLYFILGLLFGWLYISTGSLIAPIMAHVVNNVWTVVMHNAGVKFPLGGHFTPVDLLFLLPCIAICAVAFIMLNKRAQRGYPG
jgi:membrane protease YdiL (CAAX protease family)